jgi:hypothetical protein
MRRLFRTAIEIGLGLVVLGCAASAPLSSQTPAASDVQTPAASAPPSPAATTATASQRPAAESPASPSAATSPISALPSLSADASAVLAAALAVLDEGTMRYESEVRPVGTGAPLPVSTGRGQVSFRAPIQFRFREDPVGSIVPESEVIVDDARVYVSGREASYLPADAWLELELSASFGSNLFYSRYGQGLFLLTPGLGVVGAEAAGTESIRGETATRYVVQVGADTARAHLPVHLRDVYDAFQDYSGSPGTSYEAEVWVSKAGRIMRWRVSQDVTSEAVDALITTYELSDFGAPMDLDLPDGAEVLTIEEAQRLYLPSPSPTG